MQRPYIINPRDLGFCVASLYNSATMSMMQVTGRHPLLPSLPCHSATMQVTGRHPLLPALTSSPTFSGSSRHSPAVAGMRSDSDGEDVQKKGGWFEDKHKLGLSVGWFIDRASSLLHKGSVKNVKGLWDVCDSCGSMLYTRSEGLGKRICQECGHHLRMGSTDRIELLLDPGTWRPLDEDMVAQDVLKFRDEDEYGNRISVSQKMSGLTDAVQTGLGEIQGTPVALGVMDFRFMGGSMGSVVGEKITRLVEHATHLGRPLVIVCSSGGARMQEGTLSLMQMAKVSAALEVHQVQNRLLYIPILTNPTTGGVTASFGMLGDIIIAEPKAYIAFAGGRVINQTLGKKLPEGFQVAEYVFEHGLIDLIVPGNLLRSCLSEIFQLYAAAPSKELSKSF